MEVNIGHPPVYPIGDNAVEPPENNCEQTNEESTPSQTTRETTVMEFIEFYDIFQKVIKQKQLTKYDINYFEEYLENEKKIPKNAVSYRKFKRMKTIVKFGTGFLIDEGVPEYSKNFELLPDDQLEKLNETSGLGIDRYTAAVIKTISFPVYLILITTCQNIDYFLILFVAPLLAIFITFLIILCFGAIFTVTGHTETCDKKNSAMFVKIMKKYPFLQKIF